MKRPAFQIGFPKLRKRKPHRNAGSHFPNSPSSVQYQNRSSIYAATVFQIPPKLALFLSDLHQLPAHATTHRDSKNSNVVSGKRLTATLYFS